MIFKTTLKKQLRYIRKSFETWNLVAGVFGWKRSFLDGRPLTASGEPIPWYTYPAIEFIQTLDLSDCRVFEYGCGNSSIFLAKRVKEIFAAENDSTWAAEVRNANISNLTILDVPERESYVNAPYNIGGEFDIMIIDGRYRKDCAVVAGNLVREDGFIIFDNADWYPAACEALRTLGWFQVDFSGLGPINPYAWTTAIFLRSKLEIGRINNVKPKGGNPSGESKG